MPIYDVKTMAAHLHDGLVFTTVRLGATLAGAFGLLGLILTIAGVYGVVAYTVGQRTQEIGIRMALGAQPNDVIWLVLEQGFWLTGAGVISGWRPRSP